MKRSDTYWSSLTACWLAVAALLSGVACTKTYSTYTDTSKTATQSSQSLLDYLKNNYAFSIFYAGLKKAGLDQQLTADGKFTLLVPDNDAFGRAGITQDSVMKMNTDELRQWLGFHIIQGAIGYDSIPQTIDNAYFSILGQKIFFSRPVPSRSAPTAATLHINGVAVNNFDIRAANGFIQVLNTPLNAPAGGTLQDYINAHLDQFSLFKACLLHFNLWDQLKNDTTGQMTVFAPVNSAFINIQYSDSGGLRQRLDTITQYTIDSVWARNTSMPVSLFSIYLLPSRIFTSDFTDAPFDPSGVYEAYIFPDQSAWVNLAAGTAGIPQITAGLLFSYPLKTIATGTVISPGNFVTTNGNNVLQPIDKLLLVP